MADGPMDKAVILARGLGTRMRKANDAAPLDEKQAAVADSGVKALIPIDRPFLDYVLSNLADAGYRRVCLVIGPEHDQIRAQYGTNFRSERLEISFAVQQRPLGTADAVLSAEAFAGEDPFAVINSDNYYPREALADLRSLDGPGLAVFGREAMFEKSNIAPDRISKFAVVRCDENGRLAEIIEKPEPAQVAALGEEVYVSMNCWRFGPSIFPACRSIRPSARGELEIPFAVQYARDELGESFRVRKFDLGVLDMSSRDDIESVSRHLKGVEVHL